MEKGDSDSQGEREKNVVDDENLHRGLNAIPDPDAGLTEEEKAKIVSCSYAQEAMVLMSYGRTASCFGGST